MRHAPYPDYKPSGVEWVGDLPKHWTTARISAHARPGDRSFTDGDWVELPHITDSGIRLVQTGNIGIGTYREQGFRFIDESSFDELRCTEVDPGDVLICRLADPVGRACKAPDLGMRMITSVDVCILKPSEHCSSSFLTYLLSSKRYLGYVESLVRGGTRDRISRSMLGAIAVPHPPRKEQDTIAAFLDQEAARVDALIAKKHSLIDRLGEYRNSLITRTVTKGLPPNVAEAEGFDPSPRLKPSGVQWLGEVPKHWEVVQLGRLGSFFKGGGGTKEDEVDDGLPCIRYGDLYTQHQFLILQSRSRIAEASTDNYRELEHGDLLFAGSGETIDEIGKSAVNLIQGPAYCGGDVIGFRPSVEVDPAFIGYAADSPPAMYQKACMGRGVTVMHIYSSELKRLILALPPIEEQKSIASFLGCQMNHLDTLRSQVEAAIERLQEFRSALVTAAVTGKIDVRDWEPVEMGVGA